MESLHGEGLHGEQLGQQAGPGPLLHHSTARQREIANSHMILVYSQDCMCTEKSTEQQSQQSHCETWQGADSNRDQKNQVLSASTEHHVYKEMHAKPALPAIRQLHRVNM